MASGTTGSKSYSWQDVDWAALRRLRERFLAFDTAPGTGGDYWASENELAAYNLTFAERIGWKWDTVLDELTARGWAPPENAVVVDWGCGTGIAGRRVVERWRERIRTLRLSDRSRRAMEFARKAAVEQFPGLTVEAGAEPASGKGREGGEILVISHVLNELAPGSPGLTALLAAIEKAAVVLWVEPGASSVAKRLVEQRELLRQRFRLVAPCPHAGPCGLLVPGNERHWCHHFARVPKAIFQDGSWARFAREIEVDLRVLPFSMLVLDRPDQSKDQHREPCIKEDGEGAEPLARIIGEPRLYKGFAKVLACEAGQVAEVMVQKRDAPDLFKALRKAPGSLYRWTRGEREGRILDGQQVF